MSTNLISSGTTAREKVNLRTPDVMAAVQQQVESHYRSDIVDKVRRAGGLISIGDTTVRLAKQFGFCYGVERAIDLAYAARKVFQDRRLFIVGEIIHNPEVNQQIASLGIKNLTGPNKEADISELRSEEHTSELQSHSDLVCRLLLEKKKKQQTTKTEHKSTKSK